MVFECDMCKKDPTSHSFFKYCDEKEINTYYCCPIKGTNTNGEGILNHIKGVLDENNGKKWVLILDFKGYSIKKCIEISNSIEIVKLVSREEYNSLLKQVNIINSNSYVKILCNTIKPYVSNDLFDKVTFY